jgi:hypothetical protein
MAPEPSDNRLCRESSLHHKEVTNVISNPHGFAVGQGIY